MATGIEFQGVSKRYGSGARAPYAVQDISFAVPQGSLTTILGPSGCGKTTTLRMIAGLETASAGRIFIAGRDVTTLGPAERNVSMMFQSYALFPHLSVLGNVAYGLKMSGVAQAVAHARAQDALKNVGLVGYSERLPSELSGGQQQRVALARALVLEPAVLLFDEPLSNLDARLRREMRDEIRKLQQRLQLTVAYVTHDQSEALAVSDHIIVMNQGRIAQSGSPQDLYERPQTEFVAAFMGEAMVFPATQATDGSVQIGPLRWGPWGQGQESVDSAPTAADAPAVDGTATTAPTAPTATTATPVQVAVRPEAWQIGPAHTAGLRARVVKRAYLGNSFEYSFDTELGVIFVVSPNVAAALALGAPCSLTLGPRGVAVVQGGTRGEGDPLKTVG